MIRDFKQVTLEEMFPLMEEQLNQGGSVTFKPKGISMLPLIRQGVDSVVIKKPTAPLKKYDIPLYRRENKSFILHRVVKVCPDNTYIMCGDNQTVLEEGISHDQILGVVTGVYRKDKLIPISSPSLKIYSRLTVLRRRLRKSFFWRAIRWGLRKCRIIK